MFFCFSGAFVFLPPPLILSERCHKCCQSKVVSAPRGQLNVKAMEESPMRLWLRQLKMIGLSLNTTGFFTQSLLGQHS